MKEDLEQIKTDLIDLVKWHRDENGGDHKKCSHLIKDIKRAKSQHQLDEYQRRIEYWLE